MEEKNNSIPELVQQIHKAENQHNQLVDQYFAMSKPKTYHLGPLSLSLSFQKNMFNKH